MRSKRSCATRGGAAHKFTLPTLGFLALLCPVFCGHAVKAEDVVERHELGELPPLSEQTTGAVGETGLQPGADGAQAALEDQPMPPLPGQDNATLSTSSNSIELVDSKAPLRIGLMAERGPSYLQGRIEPFRIYLQETLLRPVEIVAFSSMRSLMAAHTSGQIDYATYPASIFAMAHASCGCLQPLVAPVSQKAPEGIYMLLVVRSESGIKSLADMTGHSLALSSRNGALPFHMALNELRRSGLDPDRDLSAVFSNDSPADALSQLEKGEADAALVWSTTQYNQTLFSSLGAVSAYQDARQGKRKKAPAQPDFLSIWRSPSIPAGPHAVHNHMSKQDRADLIKALTGMNQRDPDAYDAIERRFGAGFQTVTLEDYAPLIEIATAR